MHEIEQHIPMLTEPGAQYFPWPPELTELFSQNCNLFISGRAFAWHRRHLRLEKPDAYFSYYGGNLQLPNWKLDRSPISFPGSLYISFHILFMVSFAASFTISNPISSMWYLVTQLPQTKEC